MIVIEDPDHDEARAMSAARDLLWRLAPGRPVAGRVRAQWSGVVLAESDEVVVLEGNYYFPPESLNQQYFESARSKSICPWKGLASYYTVEVAGRRNEGAAWYYPHPSPFARRIKGHVAFWNGVQVGPPSE